MTTPTIVNKPTVPLIFKDTKNNKLCIYISKTTTDTEFDWRCKVSLEILKFLESNTEGICQVKIKINDYELLLEDLFHFDLFFPKRVWIYI